MVYNKAVFPLKATPEKIYPRPRVAEEILHTKNLWIWVEYT